MHSVFGVRNCHKVPDFCQNPTDFLGDVMEMPYFVDLLCKSAIVFVKIFEICQ